MIYALAVLSCHVAGRGKGICCLRSGGNGDRFFVSMSSSLLYYMLYFVKQRMLNSKNNPAYKYYK